MKQSTKDLLYLEGAAVAVLSWGFFMPWLVKALITATGCCISYTQAVTLNFAITGAAFITGLITYSCCKQLKKGE